MGETYFDNGNFCLATVHSKNKRLGLNCIVKCIHTVLPTV